MILKLGRKRFQASITVLIAMVACALLSASKIWAQSPQPAATPAPAFDVASIKPNHGDDNRVMIRATPDGFTANGVSAKFLIEFAYNVKDFQVSGTPGWADSDRYDVDAKMDEATMEAIRKLTPEQAMDQRRLMLQALLAERFKLKVSHSSKELPIYALVVAKNGPKLTQSADTGGGPRPGGPGRMQMNIGGGDITASAMTMSNLADLLGRQLGRKVVDKTELQGRYDFTLHWTPERAAQAPGAPADGGSGSAAPPPDASGPSLFTALQEQLGLKLESQKGPVETLIVDSIEKPSEN